MNTSSPKDRGRPARCQDKWHGQGAHLKLPGHSQDTTGCPRPGGFLFRSPKHSGMALVVTLSIVVLMTFLLVAFFSATTAFRTVENTSAGGVTAGILAQGAVGAVQAELMQEIITGSANVTVGTNTFYFPTAATNMLPNRAISVTATDTNFANLVKQSGQPFFPGATIFNASATNSTAAAAGNGRSISAKRWSSPMLTGAHYVTNQVPNWIYVTPNGYTNAPSPDVIGRIAFNVYDVGGVLDANVAGFAPNQGTTTLPPGADTKGPAVWADLRAIPGVNSNAFADSPTWPPQWRLTGDWKTFATNSGSSLTYYERTGWRDAYLNANGINSDRMFASRQDLIRYAKAHPGTFSISDGLLPALQYLTTFSRDINAPTFQPDPNRPKVQQASASGGNDAHGLDDQINPPLLTAVNSSGDSPAITKRFPLSRLAMVATPVPPAAPSGDAAKILEHFGLAWDSANNRWNYNHGDPGKIFRLNQIPDGRNPDFVELLKAAISVGSLGKQFGIPFPSAYDSSSQPNSLTNGFFGSVNYQIVQIAANIIDQYDADSYPTRIAFDGKEFYGVEDLPYIYKARTRDLQIGEMLTFGLTKPAQLRAIMVSPELWNPHKPSSANTVYPENFRVVASTPLQGLGAESGYKWKPGAVAPWNTGDIQTGGNLNYFSDFTNLAGPNCSTLISYSGGQGAASAGANAELTFNFSATSFREPTLLENVPGSDGFPDLFG